MSFAVLIQYTSVTDGQTDGRTDTSRPAASIALMDSVNHSRRGYSVATWRTRSSADADNALDANEAVIRVIIKKGGPKFSKIDHVTQATPT